LISVDINVCVCGARNSKTFTYSLGDDGSGDGSEEIHEHQDVEEMERVEHAEVDVDSGHGASVDHGADDTARSSYRTSLVDEDVSTLY